MKIIATLFLTFFCAVPAMAGFIWPAQKLDVLIYNGQKYELFSNLLERYFRENPDDRDKLFSVKNAYRIIVTDIDTLITISSGYGNDLVRRYIASFEIADGQLYLTGIDVGRMEKDESTDDLKYVYRNEINKVFTGQKRVKAEWFVCWSCRAGRAHRLG